MMASTIWLLFGLAAFAQGLSVKNLKDDDDVPKLEWPKQYTLKAQRMSLTSNIIENYEIWKTSKQSRIDYNNGHYKVFVIAKNRKKYRYGIQYVIQPEATIDQEVINVCYAAEGYRYHRFKPQDILPDADYFEVDGDEVIHDKDCTRFKYDDQDEDTEIQSTLWASYEDGEWVPVRYEVLEFNSWLGAKDKHEVWDFYDFDKDFSFRSVFSVDDYDCSTESASHSIDDDAVTKELLFVDPENDEHVDHVFDSFKKTHSRQYADEKEHAMRRSIFRSSMRLVAEHNRKNGGYKLHINKFADKTPEEMFRYTGLLKRPESKKGNVPFPYTEELVSNMVEDLPKEYDTRLLGYVSEVKNQEDCGSCWTFGTTGAVEGALARINGGRLMALSNQALVDCVWAFGAGGCDGGTDNAAYEWMMKYGLPTVAEYGEYTNKDGPCNILNMTEMYPIKGYTDVTPFSDGALKVALFNHGPLSVSVHVTRAFSLYSSGIFYDTRCTQFMLNHEVTLVGYGERDGDTFWILKNSWGPSWGMGGYMYISARDNICGVETEPTYVVF